MGNDAGVVVKRNESEAESWPSVTVSVTVLVPICPATGVMLTVQLGAVPPIVILESGNNVELLDATVTDEPQLSVVGELSGS
jgi:hypothetical protein